MTWQQIIDTLDLRPHPEEGGYYREIYRVEERVVPGGVWQGSRLASGGDFALPGTTMAPGFEFEDYESGTADLVEGHPDLRALIEALLPGGPAGQREP